MNNIIIIIYHDDVQYILQIAKFIDNFKYLIINKINKINT